MFMRNRNRHLPYFALITLSVLWGVGFYLTQFGLEYSGAFGFVALRCAAAAVVLAAICGKTLSSLTLHEAIGGSIIAILAVIGFGACAMALETESGSRVAFLSSIYVLIVPVVQFVAYRERPSLKLLFGGLLAFFGIGILSGSFSSVSPGLSTGDVLALIGALAIAIEIVLLSHFTKNSDPTRLAAFVMGATAILGALIGLIRGEAMPEAHSTLVGIILVFGLATAYIQFAMVWAQREVPASNAAIIYSLEPIFAALFGLALGEAIGAHEIVGGSLMVLGAIIATARIVSVRKFRRAATVNL